MTNVRIGAVFLGVLIVSACSSDEHDHPDLVTGQALFEYHCAGCHRSNGGGNFLKGIPANRHLEMSFAAARHQIHDGSERGMPAFETMSEEEANTIIAYIREL